MASNTSKNMTECGTPEVGIKDEEQKETLLATCAEVGDGEACSVAETTTEEQQHADGDTVIAETGIKEGEGDGDDEEEASEEEEEEVFQYRGSEFAEFKLTESCSLFLHRGDITRWHVNGKADAIVNAANEACLGGGGVDGAIHRAAGEGLLQACKELPEVRPGVRCPLGDAKITKGYNLAAAFVIHTVGPIYDYHDDAPSKLTAAYRNSIKLAEENNIKYIAFPAISCGIYGYPYKEAAKVALNTVKDSVENLAEVHFVLFEMPAWLAWLRNAKNVFEQL